MTDDRPTPRWLRMVEVEAWYYAAIRDAARRLDADFAAINRELDERIGAVYGNADKAQHG